MSNGIVKQINLRTSEVTYFYMCVVRQCDSIVLTSLQPIKPARVVLTLNNLRIADGIAVCRERRRYYEFSDNSCGLVTHLMMWKGGLGGHGG